MATMREEAMKYESPKTLNIADLPKVSTEVDIKHRVVNKGTPDEFEYDYIESSGKEYRVPKCVKKQLRQHLTHKPSAVSFKVLKDGSGLSTEYTVVLL
jgi:hypothetical protein